MRLVGRGLELDELGLHLVRASPQFIDRFVEPYHLLVLRLGFDGQRPNGGVVLLGLLTRLVGLRQNLLDRRIPAHLLVLLANRDFEALHLLDETFFLLARERGRHVAELELFELLSQAPQRHRAGPRLSIPFELLRLVGQFLELPIPLLAQSLFFPDLVVERVPMPPVILSLGALLMQFVQNAGPLVGGRPCLPVEPVPSGTAVVGARVRFRVLSLEFVCRVGQEATARHESSGRGSSKWAIHIKASATAPIFPASAFASHIILIWRTSALFGVQEVGRIFGNVGLGHFQLNLTQPVERGDYLTVEDDLHGRVLCQLDDLKRTSDLDLDRAGTLHEGSETPIHENLLGNARIVGYRDDQGLVKIPTIPFRPGAKVFRAEDPLIAEVLGLRHHASTGAYVGLLRSHTLRVELDINQLVQRHVSVLAKTGGGKSYLLGVLVEELLRHKVTCVIIDPHGEYGSLRFAAEKNGANARFGVESQGFAKQIQEFSPDVTLNPSARPLTFSLRQVDPRELLVFMGLTNVKAFLAPLNALVEEVQSANPDFTVRELVRAAERGDGAIAETLHERLQYVEQTHLLGPQGTSLHDLVRKGEGTLINLRGVSPDVQELVVARIAGGLFDSRKKGKIPPLFLVIEEAHNFAPQQGTVASSRILKNIASEGRKFGLGLCVVTQRAARVDKSVLSQCNTQLILQVTNPLDLHAIAQSIEGLTDGMTEMIQSLPVGVALVTGGGYHTPLFLEVRPRATRHGGESVKIIDN